jgi:hypothetical protein
MWCVFVMEYDRVCLCVCVNLPPFVNLPLSSIHTLSCDELAVNFQSGVFVHFNYSAFYLSILIDFIQ